MTGEIRQRILDHLHLPSNRTAVIIEVVVDANGDLPDPFERAVNLEKGMMVLVIDGVRRHFRYCVCDLIKAKV